MTRLILLPIALGLGLWGLQSLRHLLFALPNRKASRAAYFSAAAGLMKDLRQQTQATGFARVAGRYRGLMFDLQALPDTLTFRKLPALWVMVTVTEPQPLTGETHVMARATGQESFSTYAQMGAEVNLPPGFPADCTLRCTAVEDLPPPALLDRAAPLFSDPKVKEAVFSPKGLRLVVLAEEADRGSYLIYRDAELGRHPFPAARLQQMLEAVADLHYAQDNPNQANMKASA